MRQLILNFPENLFIEGKEYRPLNLLGKACKHIKTYVNDANCKGYLINNKENRFFESKKIRDQEFISFYHEKIEVENQWVIYYWLTNKNILDNLK